MEKLDCITTYLRSLCVCLFTAVPIIHLNRPMGKWHPVWFWRGSLYIIGLELCADNGETHTSISWKAFLFLNAIFISLTIIDDISMVTVEDDDDLSCSVNSTLRFFMQKNSNKNKQTLGDLSAIWSQNTSLTSGGCSWWYIPEDVFKPFRIKPKDYFACF